MVTINTCYGYNRARADSAGISISFNGLAVDNALTTNKSQSLVLFGTVYSKAWSGDVVCFLFPPNLHFINNFICFHLGFLYIDGVNSWGGFFLVCLLVCEGHC